MGVAECQFGIRIGMGTEIADVISLVRNAFFSQGEERARDAGSDVRYCIDSDSVVAAESFESGIEQA